MSSPDETAWESHVFSLISPDCVRRQLVSQVLDRLRTAGFAPAGWRAVRITGQQIDAVADIQRAGAGQTFRYRALDALFAVGPAIALRLLDSEPRSVAARYDVLAALKGGTPPRTRPGTIRHDLGSINAVMSLIHISDTPANSAREGMAVLGAVAATSFNAGSTLSGYLAMLAQTQPGEVRGYAEVLTAVRGRIVAALWHQLTGAGRALATELSCQGELADPKAGARIAAELSPAAGGHPLAATLPLAFDPVGPPIDMAEVAQVLAMYGCGLDAWEYAVLATSRYFEPVRPAGGHR